MAKIRPLPQETHADLQDTFRTYQKLLGYVPNSVLILQHRPKVVKALGQLAAAVWDADCAVDIGLKRLAAYLASRLHGCAYSMAHAAEAAHRAGISDARMQAVVDYRSSPLFTAAERVALDFAVAAAAQPCAVDDHLIERMRQHWTDAQIVEIAAAVAINGFLNRWNSSMAVPLEAEPAAYGAAHLRQHGWNIGRHGG